MPYLGITWQGNPAFAVDRDRSVPLAHFAPLAAVPGVRLYSLQKNQGAEQLLRLRKAAEEEGAAREDEAPAREGEAPAERLLAMAAPRNAARTEPRPPTAEATSPHTPGPPGPDLRLPRHWTFPNFTAWTRAAGRSWTRRR